MNTNRSSLGAWAAVVVGAGYLVAAVAFLLLPEAQQPGADFDQQMVSLADDRTAFLVLNWALVVVAVAGLAAVPAISSLVRGAAPEWVRWGSALVYLGFGIGVVDGLRELTCPSKLKCTSTPRATSECARCSSATIFI